MNSCVVLATGPSIALYKPDGRTAFGVNRVRKYHHVDYLVVLDELVYAKEEAHYVMDHPGVLFAPKTCPHITRHPRWSNINMINIFDAKEFMPEDGFFRLQRHSSFVGWWYHSVFSAVWIALAHGYVFIDIYGADFGPEYELPTNWNKIEGGWRFLRKYVEKKGQRITIHGSGRLVPIFSSLNS